MKKPSILIVLFFLAPMLGVLNAQASFEAFADAKKIILNSYLEVSFTLKNGNGTNFRPPSFNGFTVLSGPNRSSSVTVVNGSRSSEISYSYTLRPKRVGKIQIGRASIKADGKPLRTDVLSIEVVKSKVNANGEEVNEFYVKAEPSSTNAKVGQQILLDYKLYTTVDIKSYNILEESGYQGFFAKDIKRYDTRQVREVIDGKQYVTKVIKRVALFPQQAGALDIEPMHLQMGIEEGGKQRRPFYLNRQLKRYPIQTEAMQINVEALPPNPPASFAGAVGNYKIYSNLQRSALTTDDVISIRTTITGDGDIKRVQAPEINFPASFEVYDPRILEESTYETKDGIIGKKVIEYLALPKEPGNYEFQSEFAYYSPDSSKYVTNTEGQFQLTVRQGSKRADAPIAIEEEPELMEDIRHIKSAKEFRAAGSSFFGSSSFWVLLFFPLLVLGGSLVFKQYQSRLDNLDPGMVKSRKARKLAQKRLSTAKQFMEASDSRAFYDEISKAMLGYVCDKLQIPLSELTKENVQEKLQVLKVSEDHISKFMQLIQTTELALFAGKNNADAMFDTYEQALQVVADIESNLS